MGLKFIKLAWEAFLRLARFGVLLWDKRKELNKWMAARYTSGFLALLGTAVCLVIAVIALLTPPYLGVANDSLGNTKMSEFGLLYRESDRGEDPDYFAPNEYFTRSYEIYRDAQPIHSSQNLFVRLAMALNSLFTSDNLFDVRFLALLYLILYLPAVYLVLKAALERVSYFSEAAAIVILGTIMFSDISYLAYFNSLYADPLIFICILYIAGAALGMHKEKKSEIGLQLVFTLAAALLCLLEKRFFLCGILCAILIGSQVRVLAGSSRKIVTGGFAVILIACSVLGFYWCGEEFDEISKVHAVTRGILLEEQNPDRVLESMDIDVSYSLLTDQSLYDYYPVAEISNPLLHEEFLDKYSTMDIALYYLKNPGAIIAMWNNGLRSALNLQRSYCGNYERSVGMPPMAKSLFWSMWGAFRQRSIPSTIGYLAVLIIAYTAMSGGKVFNRKAVQRWDYIYFITMLAITAIGLCDISCVIFRSGDAQLVQFSMPFGVTMDLLLYYTVAEILHKLNILEGKHEEQ